MNLTLFLFVTLVLLVGLVLLYRLLSRLILI